MSYFVKLANTWIITNEGGGPTDDKPDVVLDVPDDSNRVSAFLNIRVADVTQVYDEWSAKGAIFLTPPIDREPEIRFYMRDPDGHLIEVGQAIGGEIQRDPGSSSSEIRCRRSPRNRISRLREKVRSKRTK